jgi:hypothetical protein
VGLNIGDESGSMIELCVGIVATVRRLKQAAWQPWQHTRAVSPITAKQSVSVAQRPPCKPGPAPHCDKVGLHSAIAYMAPKMAGRGPIAAVELTHNLDGALAVQKSGTHRENMIVLSMLAMAQWLVQRSV